MHTPGLFHLDGRRPRATWKGSRTLGSKTDPVNEFVSSTVRRIRIEKGIRVQDMARRTGIPLGSYSCLETGRYRMSLENLFRILQVLGTDIQQVWPGEITEWVEEVDDEFIEKWVARARARQVPQVSLQDVEQAVCETYAIDRQQLASPSRRRELAEARAVATVLVKETPHLSLVELSRLMRRDVSSLSHALRRTYDRLSYDRALRLKIRHARRTLNRLQREAARQVGAEQE